MRFDAQSDVAAIVYGPHDDPDRLLISFAEDLRRSGLRAVGVIQSGRSCQLEDPRLGVVMLPGGESVCLVTETDRCNSGGCRLDGGRLEELARQLAAAVKDGADLVMINRFGRSEAEGAGLVKLIAQALDADIPVLIAVPERRFSDWLRFSDGMNVKLPCRRDALDRWWGSVGGAAMTRCLSPAGTFCERTK